MNAWWVCDAECCVLARAATRGAAKTFWPDYTARDRRTFLALRTTRATWADGDGPARELTTIYAACDCPNRWPDGECKDCWDGYVVDRAATVAANAPADGPATREDWDGETDTH